MKFDEWWEKQGKYRHDTNKHYIAKLAWEAKNKENIALAEKWEKEADEQCGVGTSFIMRALCKCANQLRRLNGD